MRTPKLPEFLYVLRHKEGWLFNTRPNQRRGDMVNRLRHIRNKDEFEVVELMVISSRIVPAKDFVVEGK